MPILLDTQDNQQSFFLISSIIGVTISFDRPMSSVGEHVVRDSLNHEISDFEILSFVL